ncbi:PASTA domain-containing protein [Frigoribacterium sp. RIT-PI-h]|uniref:PASTA domain-containing protein n=1 Tax=Frigoribacterium sp. RIT-PI-h TaxID=1690245 RepID=UPI0006B8BFAC
MTSGDYVGLTEAAARAALEELGLQVDSADAGSSAPSPDQVGTVASIDPTGALEKGSSVTIYIYRAAPTPAQPSTPTATPGQIAAGETATINWPAYTGCPTGYSLTGYSYTITGGTDTSGQSAGGLGANATSLTVTASAAGNLTVSYVANCGQIASEPSPGVTITVTAPPTTPAPSPSDGSDPQ